MVNFMAEEAREARLIGAASGSCRQMLLLRGEVEDGFCMWHLEGKEKPEERPEVWGCSWRTEVEDQKVTDNQSGEQRNGQFTLDVVDVAVVVASLVPLSKSYRILRLFLYFSVIYLLYFLPGETEKKMCNLIYNITVFMLFFYILANNLFVKIPGENVKL